MKIKIRWKLISLTHSLKLRVGFIDSTHRFLNVNIKSKFNQFSACWDHGRIYWFIWSSTDRNVSQKIQFDLLLGNTIQTRCDQSNVQFNTTSDQFMIKAYDCGQSLSAISDRYQIFWHLILRIGKWRALSHDLRRIKTRRQEGIQIFRQRIVRQQIR